MPSIPAIQNVFPYRGYIKDEPVDDFGRGSAQEIILPERRGNWTNPPPPEGLRQTL